MTVKEKISSRAISDWVGDIVTLETHVEEAMDSQLKLKSADPQVTAVFQRFHDTVRASKQRAIAFQESYGSSPGNPVKQVGGKILGVAAGLIDRVREDSVAKALRDDYTAYNLLAISYTMLHTTAMALDDKLAMTFAESGLTTYAGLVQEVNHAIPTAVLADLGDDTLPPERAAQVAQNCRKMIDRAWKINAGK